MVERFIHLLKTYLMVPQYLKKKEVNIFKLFIVISFYIFIYNNILLFF